MGPEHFKALSFMMLRRKSVENKREEGVAATCCGPVLCVVRSVGREAPQYRRAGESLLALQVMG